MIQGQELLKTPLRKVNTHFSSHISFLDYVSLSTLYLSFVR